MRFKGILLDLDDTLYDYESAHIPALKAALSMLSEAWQIKPETVKAAFQDSRVCVHQQLSGLAASHHRLLYFQGVCERLNHNPLQWGLLAYETYWDCFLTQMRLREGVTDFLSAVSVPICLISDLTAHIQFRKLAFLNLQDRINAVVTSEEAGHEKPHPFIFSLALKKLKMDAHEVCMIGDNFEKDCMGALGVGMAAYWYHKGGSVPAQFSHSVTPFSSFLDLGEKLR